MPTPPSTLPGGTGFGGGIFGVIPDSPPPAVPGTYNYGIIFAQLLFRGAVTANVIPLGQLIGITSFRGAIFNFTRVEELGLNEF